MATFGPVPSRRLGRSLGVMGYEGNEFTTTENAVRDLLATTAVHPMRKDAVQELLAKSGKDWAVVRRLVAQGDLVEANYQDQTFYVRSLGGQKKAGDATEIAKP